jgi:hypothetical protein
MANIKKGPGRPASKTQLGYQLSAPSKFKPSELLGIRVPGKWDDLFKALLELDKGEKRTIIFAKAATAKMAYQGLSHLMRKANKGLDKGNQVCFKFQKIDHKLTVYRTA